jgi:TolB-like protein
LILLMLVIGFVPALILAWAFELTPDGIKLEKDVVRGESITRKTSRKLDYVIIVSLGLSLGYFIWESRFEQKTAEYESAIESISYDESPATITAIPVQAPVGDVDRNSIAVLPFANRSADSGDIYFTDGIHDDLLTQLSRIDDFSVISRTSVMEYRDTTKNLRDIARELGVANVMEGSVQRAGERVRINVQLIDANTDEHLWAEIYDRELTTDNLFDIQSEIAQAIAGALKATLSASELASVADAPTDNVEAYDLYLQARRFAQNETSNDYKIAMALYEEALVLDPEFKLAWIGLADIHMTNYWVYGGDLVNRELAREAIESARSIDPDFAELYMAEGHYWYWGFLDYERALYNLEKAIDMMPGNDEAYMWRGWASRRAGQWEQARLSMQNSLKLNPRVSFNWHEYALTLMYLHRYEEANEAAEQARKLDPESFRVRTTQARIFLQASGDIKAATKETIGVQHTEEYGIFEAFMQLNLFARRYEEALEAARNIPGELEIQREEIYLRESWAALILHLMGRQEEARKAGNAALFRLNSLRAELGEDYRLDLAEAQVRAIQGTDIEKVRALIQRSSSSRPSDAVHAFEFNLICAEVFAIAGMVDEATELVESVLSPPSDTSVHTVDLNPAFDGIRTDPAFMAMMARYR